jgi:hypothetical protein
MLTPPDLEYECIVRHLDEDMPHATKITWLELTWAEEARTGEMILEPPMGMTFRVDSMYLGSRLREIREFLSYLTDRIAGDYLWTALFTAAWAVYRWESQLEPVDYFNFRRLELRIKEILPLMRRYSNPVGMGFDHLSRYVHNGDNRRCRRLGEMYTQYRMNLPSSEIDRSRGVPEIFGSVEEVQARLREIEPREDSDYRYWVVVMAQYAAADDAPRPERMERPGTPALPAGLMEDPNGVPGEEGPLEASTGGASEGAATVAMDNGQASPEVQDGQFEARETGEVYEEEEQGAAAGEAGPARPERVRVPSYPPEYLTRAERRRRARQLRRMTRQERMMAVFLANEREREEQAEGRQVPAQARGERRQFPFHYEDRLVFRWNVHTERMPQNEGGVEQGRTERRDDAARNEPRVRPQSEPGYRSVLQRAQDWERWYGEVFDTELAYLRRPAEEEHPIFAVEDNGYGGLEDEPWELMVNEPPRRTATPVPVLPEDEIDNHHVYDAPCIICWDRMTNTMNYPCAHAVFCYSCAMFCWRRNWVCSVCRKPVKEIIRMLGH